MNDDVKNEGSTGGFSSKGEGEGSMLPYGLEQQKKENEGTNKRSIYKTKIIDVSKPYHNTYKGGIPLLTAPFLMI
eukprot:CAMPEP_0206375848 /NCGR_PEP_ID=MMETSP0294-20121207/9120_1 /ASSEMBLY_ACC=CAM_ASM_000327 /TAXON_ID=39354 /ORGANISM="Heterosigma akashiwo, Strain CCMP2393" /LENGTH=74 /DNA_ID=CAMNT_0053823839 /DNA_START=48 /DNA_END=272 /DNA_ORIENTATION=+